MFTTFAAYEYMCIQCFHACCYCARVVTYVHANPCLMSHEDRMSFLNIASISNNKSNNLNMIDRYSTYVLNNCVLKAA
jgi:hypothetical protein